MMVRREQIQHEMNHRVDQFDDQIMELQKSRFHVEFESNFRQCHLLALHQELLIIKDSQQIEDEIIDNQNRIVEKQNHISMSIVSHQSQIEANHQNIHVLTKEIDQIDQMFQSECGRDPKYGIFLRKIYRKKAVQNDDHSDGKFKMIFLCVSWNSIHFK